MNFITYQIGIPLWLFLLLILLIFLSCTLALFMLAMFVVLEVPLEIVKAIQKIKSRFKVKNIYLYNNKKVIYRARYSKAELNNAKREIAYGRATSFKVVKEKSSEDEQ